MLGFAPRPAPVPPTHALGTVPGRSRSLPGTVWGLVAGTVAGTVRAVCWTAPRAARLAAGAAIRAWPYRGEMVVCLATVAVQVLAGRAWASTVPVPWLVGADVHDAGLFGVGVGVRDMRLGTWLWATLGLLLIGAILAAIGAIQVPDVRGKHLHERHLLTLALVLSVAEFGALSTLAGWQPWSLIVGPVAAIWWAFHSPSGPDSKVRAGLIQRRLVRVWGKRITHASEGHMRVVRVTVGDHLTLLDCMLDETAQKQVVGQLGMMATRLKLAASQLSVDAHSGSAQVTLRIKNGDPLAATVRSTVTLHTAPPSTPIRVGRDTEGRPATIPPRGHMLIVGKTGAGKSVTLAGVVIGHVQRGALVYLVDLKGGIDARPLAPRCESMATTVEQAEPLIAGVVAEMWRRIETMTAEGVKAWAGRTLVLVIDEAADVAEESPDAWRDLVQIARKGRAAGVVLILATQRPTADVLPKAVTGQMDVRWIGRLTPAESEIAMEGAHSSVRPFELPKVGGRAVLTDGPDGRVIQTDHLTDGAIVAWAKAAPKAEVDAASDAGLTANQAAVLAVVQASPGRTAEQLAGRLEMDRSQMNRTLRSRGLEGLVEPSDTKPATWRATNKETAQ